ncbi:FGGY-family carbohydrate kinase [Kordiimonas sp.]|uniref:FGGY-family carbohydrate kinase n=1 Tax=Kordiimonas sp. TaxID=1970157 RepID=UPI003A912D20
MSKRYVIGIDGGTESLRAGVFDLSGNPISFAATQYSTQFPASGWAEQNPDDWWRALVRSVKQAVQNASIKSSDILGLAVDTTCCSVLMLDKNGAPIRPALIWMDVRSDAEAAKILAAGDIALSVNSNGNGPVSAEWMLPKALWLKTNEPRNWDKAQTVCEYQDYINYRLTGRMCSSVNNVGVRWHHQGKEGRPLGLLHAAGLSDLADKWPEDTLELGEVVSHLHPQVAEELGLSADIPVAQGGADAFIGMIGVGVTKPGALAFITGSSHLHLGLSDKPFHAPGVWGTYLDALIPGLHVVEGGQTSTGSVVNWFKRTLAANNSYRELDAEAMLLPSGSDGVIALDHFQGNRTPYTDALSRGAFIGLSLGHSRAHMHRALMESVAMGSRLILETMQKGGFEPHDIVLSGGVTNSPLWLQIHADIIGKPLHLTEVANAPALGCAILASVGAGVYSDIEEAAMAMVRRTRTIKPSKYSSEYDDPYATYKSLYGALKSVRQPGRNR